MNTVLNWIICSPAISILCLNPFCACQLDIEGRKLRKIRTEGAICLAAELLEDKLSCSWGAARRQQLCVFNTCEQAGTIVFHIRSILSPASKSYYYRKSETTTTEILRLQTFRHQEPKKDIYKHIAFGQQLSELFETEIYSIRYL